MDWSKWEKQHQADTRRYQQQLAAIYRSAAQEAAAVGASVAYFDPSKPFSFADYPQTKARIDKLTSSFGDRFEKVIVNGVDSQWALSNNKNNELCNWVFGDLKSKLTQEQQRQYYSNNDTARKAFAARAAKGTKLSDRVWKYTDQFKAEIELGIDLGLREGLSAADMARDLKQYLQQPEKLFRRVRDEHGVLRLSQAAKAYSPGRGVYRSSYKNALRLTATETNMAYRTADHERWQQLDFVIGIEVKRSNNQCNCPLCSSLAGKYPKDFKFTGWHPNCRCHAIPILQKIDDFAAGRPITGQIENTPKNFDDWVAQNKDRFTSERNTPYFLQDNPKTATFGSGSTKSNAALLENARIRHAARTSERISDIQTLWSKGSNIRAIERELGIMQGAPMTFEEANALRGNVNYGKGREYGINCQSCVVSNELRRKGLDVTAQANHGIIGSTTQRVSVRTELAWIDKSGVTPMPERAGGVYFDGYKGKNRPFKVMMREFSELTGEVGRYHLSFGWKGSRNSGHIITAERLKNGALRFYDPQNGAVISDFDGYAKDFSLFYGIEVLRVDTLGVNTKIIKDIVTGIK